MKVTKKVDFPERKVNLLSSFPPVSKKQPQNVQFYIKTRLLNACSCSELRFFHVVLEVLLPRMISCKSLFQGPIHRHHAYYNRRSSLHRAGDCEGRHGRHSDVLAFVS